MNVNYVSGTESFLSCYSGCCRDCGTCNHNFFAVKIFREIYPGLMWRGIVLRWVWSRKTGASVKAAGRNLKYSVSFQHHKPEMSHHEISCPQHFKPLMDPLIAVNSTRSQHLQGRKLQSFHSLERISCYWSTHWYHCEIIEGNHSVSHFILKSL